MKISCVRNTRCLSLKEYVESVAPLGEVAKSVDVPCRPALSVLAVPRLIRTMNISYIAKCGHPEPHLHVMRVRQRHLTADCLHNRTAHYHFRRGDHVERSPAASL